MLLVGAMRVARETLASLVLGCLDEVVEEVVQQRSALVIERTRIVQCAAFIEHAQTGVEVVELGVEQVQRDHANVQAFREEVVDRILSAVSPSAPEQVASGMP